MLKGHRPERHDAPVRRFRNKQEAIEKMSGVHSEETDHLFRALLQLRTVDECYSFFEDICTVREINSVAAASDILSILEKAGIHA